MMLARIENAIVDDMTHRQVRYVEPVQATKAEGVLAQLYDQIRSDFQLVPPLTMFSAAPELLAGIWSIWRESQFAAGIVPRSVSETIASSVSRINVCPYCVDAHTGMLHASSDHDIVKAIHANDISLIKNNRSRNIVAWAFANRTPAAEILRSPPFTIQEAPEIIGTAIVYHFVNRMVNIFLEDSPLPVPAGPGSLRRTAVKIFGVTLAKSILKRQPRAGESLTFIPDARLPADMEWALANPNIAAAFAGFANIIEAAVEGVLAEHVRNITLQQIQDWHGGDMIMNRSWLDESISVLNDKDKPVARLTLMTALAPYQISEKDIQAFRSLYPNDSDLLAVTSWASFSAARRVGTWLANYQAITE